MAELLKFIPLCILQYPPFFLPLPKQQATRHLGCNNSSPKQSTAHKPNLFTLCSLAHHTSDFKRKLSHVFFFCKFCESYFFTHFASFSSFIAEGSECLVGRRFRFSLSLSVVSKMRAFIKAYIMWRGGYIKALRFFFTGAGAVAFAFSTVTLCLRLIAAIMLLHHIIIAV